MKKRKKENRARKKRGKDNIPILLYTEIEGEKRGKLKPQKRKSAEKRKSHMPENDAWCKCLTATSI